MSYWVLAAASRVRQVMGETGIRILVRIMGLLLVALAMQFFVNGLTDLGIIQRWDERQFARVVSGYEEPCFPTETYAFPTGLRLALAGLRLLFSEVAASRSRQSRTPSCNLEWPVLLLESCR